MSPNWLEDSMGDLSFLPALIWRETSSDDDIGEASWEKEGLRWMPSAAERLHFLVGFGTGEGSSVVDRVKCCSNLDRSDD